MSEQLKLLGLYVVVLLCGAGALYLLRGLCVKIILGRAAPEAEAMIAPLGVTMFFVGLLQALGLWALASRWTKVSLLYGVLGLGYWLALLILGTTPDALLTTMPIAAGLSFVILFVVWLVTWQKQKRPTAR